MGDLRPFRLRESEQFPRNNGSFLHAKNYAHMCTTHGASAIVRTCRLGITIAAQFILDDGVGNVKQGMDLVGKIIVGSDIFTGANDEACDDPVRSFLKQWPVSTHAFFGCASLLKYGIDDFCCDFIRQFFHMRWIADIYLFYFYTRGRLWKIDIPSVPRQGCFIAMSAGSWDGGGQVAFFCFLTTSAPELSPRFCLMI
ncbi:hypothetical protein GCM10010981_46020 [Dyella nitratireducens]|uniref:Uncharacterized protein n=1 Tax=Dyella nitratireducens TaxID=1849580 RepID=A0ABQ1GW21_9GAMM|nr:hypothetical protein GCM10010981_46020 [Dyella nitratireducens]GLQ41705.1 hypothetical protein GCM10007902_15550 [Dyella nitratireducens]